MSDGKRFAAKLYSLIYKIVIICYKDNVTMYQIIIIVIIISSSSNSSSSSSNATKLGTLPFLPSHGFLILMGK